MRTLSWIIAGAHLLMLGWAWPQAAAPKRLETLLLLPEPKAMGTELSVAPKGAMLTVLTPARELADVPGIATYSKVEFKRVGLSVETFQARARAAADKLLASFKPEFVRDDEGKVAYAVIRSERPVVASLVVAPSLARLFEEAFGKEVWVALPTRRVMYVFPAQPEALQGFVDELAERYRQDPHAASAEVFAVKAGEEPRVVAGFGE
jgi:hypothetical protein